MRRALPVVAVAAILAGCGGSHAPQVAWAPLRPTAPPAARTACTGSQLHGTVSFQGATGGAVGELVLRNTRSAPCSLAGRPTIRVVNPAVPQVFSKLQSTGTGTLPIAWLGSVGGNRQASVDVTWFNWCNRSKTPVLKVVLPKGAGIVSVKPSAASLPRCIVAGTPTTISAGTFASALGQAAPPWTRITPLQARVLGPKGQNPPALTAARGTTLEYRVELTNGSQHTLAFDKCPLFEQHLAPALPQTYVLNCSTVKPLRPGKSAVFDMELPVPLTQPLGPNGLFWALDPYSTAPAVDAGAAVAVKARG